MVAIIDESICVSHLWGHLPRLPFPRLWLSGDPCFNWSGSLDGAFLFALALQFYKASSLHPSVLSKQCPLGHGSISERLTILYHHHHSMPVGSRCRSRYSTPFLFLQSSVV